MRASLQPDLRPDRPPPIPWSEYESWLLDLWAELLASDPLEPQVQTFLEAHPALLPGGNGDIGPGGHHGSEYEAVYAEPPLHGLPRDRRPDFMWVTRSTSLITPICIEIERPRKRWFNQSGTPTKELTQALDQLVQWKVWFSEPENQAIFWKTYLRGEDRDRQLLPQYVLIFGRREEFDDRSGIHDAPRRLTKKREFMARRDEHFLTFDSLRPREDYRDSVTLKMTASGPVLHRIPPSFTTGPETRDVASAVRNPRPAIDKTELWSDERKAYVLERWSYWQKVADADRRLNSCQAYSLERGE
ncbi:MAG: Shedu anti-phage system protein SduA domain-containing protein [Pseudonocardiaceae bacterium]